MTEVLRRAVVESEKTRYVICKATDIEQSSLSRFMDGQTSLRLDKADALAEFLGLALVARKAGK